MADVSAPLAAVTGATMEDLNEEQLASFLASYLDAELVTKLKDQKVKGGDFMRISESDLKLFGFSLGHVLQIKAFKDRYESNNLGKPGTPSSPKSSAAHDRSDSLLSDEEDDQEITITDKDLLTYMSKKELDALDDYERLSLKNQLRNYRQMESKGVPCGSLPKGFEEFSKAKSFRRPSRPLQPVNQKDTTHHVPTRTSSRVVAGRRQLIAPRLNEDVNDDDEENDENGDEINLSSLEQKEMYKVSADNLLRTAEQLQEIKPNIGNIDVKEIIVNHKDTKKCIAQWLEDGFVLASKDRKKVFRILMKNLCWVKYSHPNEVPTDAMERLAKSFVCSYPQYQKPIDVKGKSPWSHIYAPGGRGHFANVKKRIQTSLPDEERKRKSNPKKRKVDNSTQPINHNVDKKALASIYPGRAERETIYDGMSKTFKERESLRRRGHSITELLMEFPQFVNYKGDLITLEFKAMYPDAKDMVPLLNTHSSKILEKWDQSHNLSCTDEGIKACYTLACKLPHVIARNANLGEDDSEIQPSVRPVESELIVILDPKDDIEDYVSQKRSESAEPIQPYLIGIKSALTTEILKYFLVLDGKAIELGKIQSIRAVDWVFKSCVAFNVHYPPSWNNFFRLLQTCYYQVFFKNEDDAPASSIEIFSKLQGL